MYPLNSANIKYKNKNIGCLIQYIILIYYFKNSKNCVKK